MGQLRAAANCYRIIMRSMTYLCAFFSRRVHRRIASLLLTAGGVTAIAVTSVTTCAQPGATAPAAAAASAAPATEPVLAPTPVLGMGNVALADAAEAMAQRFSTAAYETVQVGENQKDLAAWRQAAAFLEAAAALVHVDPPNAPNP